MDNKYILLDAARMHGDIYRARELNPDHTCLYEGDSEKFLSAVAPWLFSMPVGSAFATWVSEAGGGNSWGILLRCAEEPVILYKHLRKFLIVASDDGKEMHFRYYDPRVLRVFLPTCEPEQLIQFFGPINAFLVEDQDGMLVEYAQEAGKLVIKETGQNLLGLYGEKQAVGSPKVEYIAPPQIDQQPDRGGGSSAQPKGWDFGY